MIGTAAAAGVGLAFLKSKFAKNALVIVGVLVGGIILLGVFRRKAKKALKVGQEAWEDRRVRGEIEAAFDELDRNPDLTVQQREEAKAEILRSYNVDPGSEFAKTLLGVIFPPAMLFAPPEWLKNLFKKKKK